MRNYLIRFRLHLGSGAGRHTSRRIDTILCLVLTTLVLGCITAFSAEHAATRPQKIDYGTLSDLERVVGFLVSTAAAIGVTFLVNPNQKVVDRKDLDQTRRLSFAASAVYIAVTFGFFATSTYLSLLAYFASGGLVIGIALFFVNLALRFASSHPATMGEQLRYLMSYFFFVFLVNCGLASAGLVLLVVLSNPANATAIVQKTTRVVSVTLEGTTKVSQPGSDAAFRTSSGYVAVDCGATASAQALWTIPQGATIVGAPQAQWVGLSNVTAQAASATINGNVVTATGTIHGQDFQQLPFGIRNCPGGGHGELVLAGVVKSADTIERRPFSRELSGEILPGPTRNYAFTLPPKSEVELARITVGVQDKGAASPSATLKLEAPFPDEAHPAASPEKNVSVYVKDDQLMVQLPA